MSDELIIKVLRAFVSFLDESTIRNVTVDNVEIHHEFVKFESQKNIFLVPWHKIIKVKIDRVHYD